MLDIIKQTWSSFTSRPDVWFFYMFLMTSTLSIRKVLFFYPINNSFNEYTGVYIYLSDIFLFLTFLFYILYNINSILSILKSLFADISNMFHVEHSHPQIITSANEHLFNVPRGTLLQIKKTYALIINYYFIFFPLGIVFFSFFSIMWTTNTSIALFRSIKLLEFALLYFYVLTIVPRGTIRHIENHTSSITKLFHVEQLTNCKINNSRIISEVPKDHNSIVPRGTILENILVVTIATGVIQSIIGIFQFIFQHSIGLFFFKESLISTQIPGVAKIILNGEAYIRAYGLFPHPNVLGGYLALSIILSILYIKIINNVPRGTLLPKLFLYIQIIALFLTFSKSAIIALLIGLCYSARDTSNMNVPRGTFVQTIRHFNKMFHVEHFKRRLVLTIAILALFFFAIKPDLNSLFIKSLSERALFLNVSRGTLLENPIMGIGAGQFIPNMSTQYNLESWQYQPVHNVYILIANEYGIIIAFSFIFFLFTLFKNKNCSTWNNNRNTIMALLKGLLLAFFFIMLFDHYFWDIQQGSIMLWILFGIIASQCCTCFRYTLMAVPCKLRN